MRILSSNQVETETLTALGVSGATGGLDSREVLSAAIRRAASFACPCSARSLTTYVFESLAYLAEDHESLRISLDDVLEELLAIGDLQEHRNVSADRTSLLYLAPPSYVLLSGGEVVVLGVAPDNMPFLPEDVAQSTGHKSALRYVKREPSLVGVGTEVSIRDSSGGVECYTITLPNNANPKAGIISVESPVAISLLHKIAGDQAEIRAPSGVRTVRITQVRNPAIVGKGENLASRLSQLGLVALSEEDWLNAPPDETPDQCIARFNRVLDRASSCGDIPDLEILDSTRGVRYYRGRWSPPKQLTGRYIGRRPQAYGNNIWCYLEIQGGRSTKCLDLPLQSSTRLRGCDEAWRLQAALDARHGQPQRYRLRGAAIDVFSPIPGWMERRWNWLGKRVENKGCLLSFEFRETEIEQEVDFLRRKLWCDESTD